ncbi:MAG: DegT/DnrJ/EryC1/StrS family aminotransferase [Candidatus Omnitrophota bacterium]
MSNLSRKKKSDNLNAKGWRFAGNERRYLDEVLSNGFTAGGTGTMTERLENGFAALHKKKYAIGANSGTSTLHMALKAFGVGPGDEVIVPGLTVAMCGFAIWQCQATPVFTDVREDTFLLDPADIEKKISKKTKPIMPVHLYGLMCDMGAILKIAKKHDLYIVEDCAQCYLAEDGAGRIAGTAGDVGSWSFENSKHISTGDGGIVLTDNERLAEYMRQFGGVGFKNITATSGKVRIDRDKFQDPSWLRHSIPAYNYRLPELCAAVALAQLERVKLFCKLRITMGLGYLEVIRRTKTRLLVPQKTPRGYTHSYFTFAALFRGGECGIGWQEFRKKHIENGGDGIYAAWQTLNNEPCFKNNNIGYGRIPVAEKLQQNLMQFTTNQHDGTQRNKQFQALEKTIKYFSK